MDGLALLCNLFADGPVTLARLRAAEVAGLAELARARPAELAGWLRSSESQARAFAAEARKLEARLGHERAAACSALAAPSVPAPSAPPPGPPPPRPRTLPAGAPLRAGLVDGLDEHVCARLAEHGVRSVQALAESAGLALARRTGIPYARLLALASAVRRSARGTPAAPARADDLAVVELVPHRPALARPGMPEPARSDEFTLPLPEPESAGPFG